MSANRYWRSYGSRIVVSAEAKSYKTAAGLMWASLKGGRIESGEIHVEIVLRPKLTKKREASKTRMDLDNCIKVTLDALNGLAFTDDSQVVSIAARIGQPVIDGGLMVGVSRME